MAHSIKPNHKFVAVRKDGVVALYSAVHLGRVKSWVKTQEDETEILTKEAFYSRGDEMIDIEFINPHSSQLVKTSIRRADVGKCVDPRCDSYWQL